MPEKAHRLPSHVVPRAYEVHLRAAPGEARFHGRVRIALELARATDTIELHARDLAFTSVGAEQGARLQGTAVLDKDHESALLRFPRALRAGPATLDLAYDAPVSPSMQGLYLSKDGPEECLVTQCEATDARAVFPCWDEPAFKATLRWTVTTAKGLTVLANGPLLAKRDEGDRTTWEFAATPPIPAYLAAVAIGRFGGTAQRDEAGVPFRVWAMEGKEHLGLEARDAAARMLPWYNAYFGVPYRFGKYDQLAVPSFSFGAMENAGLVVFRASRLLMDPKTAGWRDRRDITLVVAHEFAHQWFGNHVTMRWWDDLWLNESFAEWIAHRNVDALWPEHEIWLDFQSRTTRALGTDSLGATHPVWQPIATPAEASELFDAITYGKGSSVLRMLEGFLGADTFEKGLRTYMAEFGGANAAGADLWSHLGRAAKQPVERIMRSWIEQPGHPVLRVRVEGQRVHLAQQRFRSLPGASPATQVWDVPVVLRYHDGQRVQTARHLLSSAEGEVTLPARPRWVHANGDDVGFYRCDPDDAAFAALQEHFDELTPAERVGLLRDQWGLVRSGQRPPQRILGLLAATTARQRHYAVVEQAADTCRAIEATFEAAGEDRALHAFRPWVGQLFRPILGAFGPDARTGEPPATGLARAAAYRAVAGIAREPGTVQQALALADRELREPASVDANVAGTVVALAAQVGDGARFDAHVRAYTTRRDAKRPPQEADRYLGSFPQFRPPELVRRTLALLEDGTVPKQSIGPLLVGMLREPHAQALAWEHVAARWDALREKLGDSWAGNLVEASGALPPRHRKEVEALLDAKAGDLVQSRARARDLLAERAAVFERVVPALARAV